MPKPLKRAPKSKKTFGTRTSETKKTKGMQLCSNCGAMYFSGHWHNTPAVKTLMRITEKKTSIATDGVLCNECRFLVHGKDPKHTPFEGEVTIDGFVDLADKEAILKTVRNAGARAEKRDPLDHIIAINDRKDRVVVTTTENQLAVAIGKAVDAAFKGGKLTITFGDDGDMPARVHWTRKLKARS